MIDIHYGHLAVDSYHHAVSLLDALALERAVDAGWTSPQGRNTAQRFGFQASRKALTPSRGRSVDVEVTSHDDQCSQKALISRSFCEAL
jgi:hypothetical protein